MQLDNHVHAAETICDQAAGLSPMEKVTLQFFENTISLLNELVRLQKAALTGHGTMTSNLTTMQQRQASMQ